MAARTPREAEESLDLIEVEYEELPGVFDPEEAVDAAAPLLHEGLEYPPDLRPDGRNVCHRFRLRAGLGRDGFTEAEVVVEETFTVAGAAHVAMEPHATLAYWAEGRLHVITGTQTPFNLRRDLAALFRIPQEMIRVVVAPMGGSFGAKTFMRTEPVTAALARKAGRPVRTVLTRAEEFLTLNRHPARFRMRLGARRDGTFVAKSVDAWWDTGAYADCGPSICTKGGYAAIGPYRIPHVTVDSRCVYTNRPPAGAFRGYAATQAVWASERMTDLMADHAAQYAAERGPQVEFSQPIRRRPAPIGFAMAGERKRFTPRRSAQLQPVLSSSVTSATRGQPPHSSMLRATTR